jgi:hypothetical protein
MYSGKRNAFIYSKVINVKPYFKRWKVIRPILRKEKNGMISGGPLPHPHF